MYFCKLTLKFVITNQYQKWYWNIKCALVNAIQGSQIVLFVLKEALYHVYIKGTLFFIFHFSDNHLQNIFAKTWFMSKVVINNFTYVCMVVHTRNKTIVDFSHIPPSPTIKVVLVYEKDHSKGSFKIWLIQYSMQLN